MKRFLPLAVLLLLLVPIAARGGPTTQDAATPPKVGDKAPGLMLSTLDGQTVSLADLCKAGPVVVIQLRGWVGYQCPICTRQVGDFIKHADDLRKAGATIVLVYPGAPEQLKQHAEDFVAGKSLPDNFRFVTDPGLKFVTDWGLRWDKPGENAYPATFVVGSDGTVQFAKVSHSHGGRATATEVLAALAAKP